ncbi:MAG TPA: DUF1345 domain-containing protein [Candidatus Saccharimonadales bacterium]|nr:DUF1345 domain-containing protein [Candidatus Saccharimonadales bacterium]
MKQVRKKQTRFLVAFVVAIIAAAIAAELTNRNQTMLIGWDAGAIALLIMLWRDFAGHDAERTAVIARRDDMNQSLTDIVLVVASVASIVAVAVLLKGSSGKGASLSDIGFGLLSIVISWAVVHSVFMLRYAAMYYRSDKKGIDFNSSSPPRFSDFAYLSFTIGMTYQVSDTNFENSTFRAAALRHALLSFIFGTAIIATTINFIASLAR